MEPKILRSAQLNYSSINRILNKDEIKKFHMWMLLVNFYGTKIDVIHRALGPSGRQEANKFSSAMLSGSHPQIPSPSSSVFPPPKHRKKPQMNQR